MPAKEDDGSQGDPEAVGGSQHHRSDQVQGSVGEQKGIVAVDGALDRTQDGEGADAKEQDSRRKSFAQAFAAPAVDEMLKMAIDVKAGADDAAKGQTDDKENRIVAVWHIADNRVDADPGSSHAHGVKQDFLMFFF